MPPPFLHVQAIPGGIEWTASSSISIYSNTGTLLYPDLGESGYKYLPLGTYVVVKYPQIYPIGTSVTVSELAPVDRFGYHAHTCVCLDLAIAGTPITTLGLKAVDAHVNALDQAFFLAGFGTDLSASPPVFTPFIASDAGFSHAFNPDFTLPPFATNTTIYAFNSSRTDVPIRYLSPDLNFNARHERKRFRFIEFHGRGTAAVRVFVDGRLVNSGNICATEDPSHQRKFMLPRGTRGYTLKLEVAGLIDIRLIEVAYEPMPWTS